MPVMLECWNDDKMDALAAEVALTREQLREHRREMREDMRDYSGAAASWALLTGQSGAGSPDPTGERSGRLRPWCRVIAADDSQPAPFGLWISESAGRLLSMTTREKAHRLLDELPESEVEPVVKFFVSRQKGDDADNWGDMSTLHDSTTASTMRRLNEEERAAGHEPW